MIIRNDASSHIFLALLAGRPMTDDRSSLIAKVYQILCHFAFLLVEKRIYRKEFKGRTSRSPANYKIKSPSDILFYNFLFNNEACGTSYFLALCAVAPSRETLYESFPQILRSIIPFFLHHIFRCAFERQVPPFISSFRSQIDHPIG